MQMRCVETVRDKYSGVLFREGKVYKVEDEGEYYTAVNEKGALRKLDKSNAEEIRLFNKHFEWV